MISGPQHGCLFGFASEPAAGLETAILSKSSTLTKQYASSEACGKNVRLLIGKRGAGRTSLAPRDASLALSGSDQAREGRLVDALAARGDEGRDTLR